MITDSLISILDVMLGLMPSFEVEVFTIDASFYQLCLYAGYFLPMDLISKLFILSLVITGIRLVWAIILRVKSFIPGWGN